MCLYAQYFKSTPRFKRVIQENMWRIDGRRKKPCLHAEAPPIFSYCRMLYRVCGTMYDHCLIAEDHWHQLITE